MKSISFILSTGRTGTKFFEKYLTNTCENMICLHEPKPSRRFKFVSNLYQRRIIGEYFVCKIFYYSRRRLLVDSSLQYVESNNFIFGALSPLKKIYNNIKVVHIVRNPFSYVESHLNHGFWHGHKRIFAKYVPFWLENVSSKNSNDPILILLDRWVYVNRIIKKYNIEFDYKLFRFEDLFSINPEIALNKMNELRNFLGCNSIDDVDNLHWINKPLNRSKVTYKIIPTKAQIIYLENSAKDLLDEFGYYFE